jgi:uncharacterized protein (TIGR02453 family)
MPNTFKGFSPKALTFLRQLEKNNSREWFVPRKEQFETLLRQPMLELIELVLKDLRSFAVDHVLDPKRAMLRIYRDVRFSKDKSPYKTNIAAMFPRAGMGKTSGAGYYIGISPAGVEVAGGVYMPGPPELSALRKAIDEDADTFRKTTGNKAVVKVMGAIQGEQMTRVPKGFTTDHPAGDLLRRKQFYYFTMMKPQTATVAGLDRTILRQFRAMSPVIYYLNDIMLRSAAELAADERPKRPKPMF